MKFATAINCIDGRTQEPVTGFVKEAAGVDAVDMITEAGADKLIAELPNGDPVIENVRKKLDISIGRHGSKFVVVAGHAGCVANPASDDEAHKAYIRKAVRRVGSWYPDVKVVGVWVDAEWKASEVG